MKEEHEVLNIQFNITRASPEVPLNNRRWYFTNTSNSFVRTELNTSCTDCYPRFNFSADLLSLTITSLQVIDYGCYELMATNFAGSDSNYIDLEVLGEYYRVMCLFNMYSLLELNLRRV